MKKIIFVCLGNICRSPIAQGCAKRYIQEHKLLVEACSAGTGNYHIGEPPCPNSIKVAKSYGIDISSFHASQFTQNDINKYDLVVALDSSNYNDLKSIGTKNLVKLGNYGFDGEDVPDPYFFEGFEGFEKVFGMIESCVKNLLESKIYKTK